MVVASSVREFNCLNCEIEMNHYVSSGTSTGMTNVCSGTKAPMLRVAFNFLFGLPVIVFTAVGGCEDDKKLGLGLNIAVISVTALNLLVSFIIWSKVRDKERLLQKDEGTSLLGSLTKYEISEILCSVKKWELFISLVHAVFLAGSISLLVAKC